ncbi:MAG TPA: DegT/DnrJ/EryC1/StrS family aminotransferase [Rhodopila sp.]|uniref:DegT/DnrJ/EryC1/StrS family aminotransferase n=1 Tax=Rhodopila sp. TaxID=2480087 RepID=UPI002B5879DE|nr:DegT/DnrJ/EryC1/StrS family aminotransferase [Rhodopila sp.]HVY16714.1 DegT/DnrJ/EryC1/StrS family aminotransferase [Rhodopila sp.]
MIPQANPGAGYRALKAEIDDAVGRALSSGWYVLGQELRAFEAEFAAWLGVPSVIGCGNGTDAIALALRGLGIGPGSAVVTVSHTAVATVAAIEMAGATPLLIDIDPVHYTLDPDALAEVLAYPPPGLPPIRAVIAVHLYGQPADLDRIVPLCRDHGIALVEDCAQAHGARLHGQRVGTFGDAATFSFYPTKNLGALGDGGAVAVKDPDLGARIAALRQYGWRQHYISDEVGVNSRLDEVQAAILRVKLPHLDAQNERRRRIAKAYTAALPACLVAPSVRADAGHAFHLYVLRSSARDAVQADLRGLGVGTGIHYPVPVHRQPAYKDRVRLWDGCRKSETAAAEVLSLPLYPELTDQQVQTVCRALHQIAGHLGTTD